MKSLLELSCEMYDDLSKESVLFFYWEPNDPESTSRVNLNVKLSIVGIKGFNKVFLLNVENIVSVMKLIESMINSRNIPIVGYNFKNLFTLFKRISGKSLYLTNMFDLYWYESYCGLESTAEDINQAVQNLKQFSKSQDILGVYKRVYLPLITGVLPSIESFGLRHDALCTRVFSNYIVEGQENGRLSCTTAKKNTFNPHTLSEDKSELHFIEHYKYFMQLDYKNMEVSVLATLAEDESLIDIISSGKDVYADLFDIIVGCKQVEDARVLGKKMFLPLIYGQTASSLSNILNISVDQSEKYITKARESFPKSFAFVERAMHLAKTQNYVVDAFGRKRYFKANEYYKARNFIIQSPASLICLYYLVKLYKGANNLFSIIFHVHDGYFLAVKKDQAQEAFLSAKKILEGENDILPSLKLKVSAKVGLSLNKMMNISNRERQTK